MIHPSNTNSAVAGVLHKPLDAAYFETALHRTQDGGLRPGADATELVELIQSGDVVVDDFRLPLPCFVGDLEIAALSSASGYGCVEGPLHRRLKFLARLAAEAIDPGGLVLVEHPLTKDRFPMVPDVTLWHASGVARTFEAGAIDGRKIVALLETWAVSVTVLPFAGHGEDMVTGYTFRHIRNPPPDSVDVDGLQRALWQLRSSRPEPLAA